MKVLSIYIIKEVIKGSLLALILLLTLFNLFTFSDELKDIGIGNYGIKQILLYLALTSPRVMYELIPSSALLGSLFVVGSFANNREIVAMRAGGFSIFWIIKTVMLAGLIMVIFAFIIGELVAPNTERMAQIIKTKAQNNQVVMRSRNGMWLRENNLFINVRQISEQGEMSEIYLYEVDETDRLKRMTQAETARFNGDRSWILEKIRQSELSSQAVFSETMETKDWKSSIDPDLVNVVVVKSENLSLYDLYVYIVFLKQNNQKSLSYELAFWSRFVNPFITFVMLMVSIPFVISIKRGMGTGGRMLTGIVIAMTFNIFDKLAGHLGLVYEFNPLLMAVIPGFMVFLAAAYATSRARF